MIRPRLLPCPFCGGAAGVIVWPAGHVVECMKCGAQGPSHPDNPERAAALWNTRTEAPAHGERPRAV